MTLNEIARKHGYTDSEEVMKALHFAGRWLQRNKGKRAPIHIQRAIDVLAAFQTEQAALANGVQARLSAMARNPRYYFGAIPNGARFVRARRWARRTFNLYLDFARMVDHFSVIIPPDSGRHWREIEANAGARQALLAEFANAANVVYGLAEQPRGSLPAAVAIKALEKIK